MSIEKKTQNCSTASEDDDRIRETSNATSKHSAPATDLKSKQRQPFEHHHPDFNSKYSILTENEDLFPDPDEEPAGRM